MNKGSGILLHITSLPSKYGIGDLGPAAYEFVDYLRTAGQKYWQILPLNPTNAVFAHSPYSSYSAFGTNQLLISIDKMIQEGWLVNEDLNEVPNFSENSVNYDQAEEYKNKLFPIAFKRFREKQGLEDPRFINFCKEHSSWLDDFALFCVIKKEISEKGWSEWQRPIRDRNLIFIRYLRIRFRRQMEQEKFLQYVFFTQWFELKKYANQQGISIIGDIPIYVGEDSVDVWTHPDLFKLNDDKKPLFVAGVPPDYFSETGQRWGNPVYDWKRLQQTNFSWWINRLRHNLKMFDVVRIDHFRGLVAYWEIPSSEPTAVKGYWVDIPVYEFLDKVKQEFRELPIIAEDLGVITEDVVEVMEKYDLPGMKILLFAFNGDLESHPYLPHNYTKKCVVYTGTHDNNTVRGWFDKEASESEKTNFFNYIKDTVPAEEVNWEMIKLALNSNAAIAIIPIQDVLGLGQEARMNKPATVVNNWKWRMYPTHFSLEKAQELLDLTQEAGR